jgi:hypothetical protein
MKSPVVLKKKNGFLKLFSNEREDDLPLKIIKENTIQEISFNVMPNRTVKEKIYIREYRIWENSIEVVFDREYFSQMLHSPDHLIFLSAQVQFQKLIYVYMCYKLGIKYDPFEQERVKVWPTRVDCKIPKMIRNNKHVRQTLVIESFVKKEPGVYFATATTLVNNSMVIYGEALIYVLGKA